jgi:hypothetical protein
MSLPQIAQIHAEKNKIEIIECQKKNICENQRHLREKKNESPADCADSRRKKRRIINRNKRLFFCENQRVLRETKKLPQITQIPAEKNKI